MKMAFINTFASPKRDARGFASAENFCGSPPLRDITMFPWNWGTGAQTIALSPSSSCGSPESESDRLRRGRPKTDSISSLIIEGSRTPSNIRCKICKRVFPREKSLQAHMRTHTGERPYMCDYPGCDKAFCQSGQLKTHQRLHTGEKPFACSAEGCKYRFTHANRHCPEHPEATLRRQDTPLVPPPIESDENRQEILDWFSRQAQMRQGKHTQRRSLKRSLALDIENEAIKQKQKLSGNKSTPCQSGHGEKERLLGALALIQLSQSSQDN